MRWELLPIIVMVVLAIVVWRRLCKPYDEEEENDSS